MLRRRRKDPADLRANLTPMIDIVFQLIIFFMVVAQITRQRAVELTPPMIEIRAGAETDDKEPPVVINVVPGALGYRLGDETFDRTERGLAALTQRIGEAIARRPAAAVQVRADRLEDYQRVRPALEAARAAGAPSVGLVTMRPRGGES